MKTIRTVSGFEILVDDEDFALVSMFSWQVQMQGRRNKKPRVCTYIGGRKRRTKIYLSRMLLREPPCQVDHESGDTLDHRRQNLRPATSKQNSQNQAKQRRLCTSKYKGVSRREAKYKERPWQACIRVHDRRKKVGNFACEIEAAKAYDRAAVEHYGEFAYTNFAIELDAA